jgi:hypothetical protein
MARAILFKKSVCTSKLGLNLRKERVKCYVWSIVLCVCGNEIGTVRKVDQVNLESFGSLLLKKDGEDQLDRSCEE